MRNFLAWLGTRVFLVLAVTFTLLVGGLAGAGKTDVGVALQAAVIAGLSLLCWVAAAGCYVVQRD
jgi:hypothetical protein